jgi:uncharacterized protein with NRDE domain
MCLIAWSWQPGQRRTLLLAANRDEWLQRPASPMHWWEPRDDGVPPLLAGRDLQGGGTWLGLRRDGLLAALTNVREPGPRDPARPSRGDLPLRFLRGQHPLDAGRRWESPGPKAWAQELQAGMQAYAGFNLLLADLRRASMCWVSNRAGLADVEPGLHGLSNAALNTPWPKVQRLKQGVEQCLRPGFARGTEPQHEFEFLLERLADPRPAPDDLIPPPPEGMRLSEQWSRGLSAPFIRLPDYGTRCSTLLRADADGTMHVLELQRQPEAGLRREYRWNWREC